MDCIVLAGGFATRLWPITSNRPKMLLPLGERTVIDYIISELQQEERIGTIHISTNAAFEEAFRQHFNQTSFDRPNITIETTEAEEEKLGTIQALQHVINRENIGDDLLVVGGDNYFSFDISAFIDRFEAASSTTIATYDLGSRESASQYGVVTVTDGQISDFQEKPEKPRSPLISTACYAFPEETLPVLDDYIANGNNPDAPGWFINWLLDQEPVNAFEFDGAWFDIGTRESYLNALAHVSSNGPIVADTATLKDAKLGDNVLIMENVDLNNVDLKNSVIFPGTEIKHSTLRSTVVDKQAKIEEISTSGALIGAYSQL